MNEFDLVQLISLLGFLILVGSAFVGQRLNWKKGAVMALTWAGIFVMCFLFISLVTE